MKVKWIAESEFSYGTKGKIYEVISIHRAFRILWYEIMTDMDETYFFPETYFEVAEEYDQDKWFYSIGIGVRIKVRCLNDKHIDVELGKIYNARILETGTYRTRMLAVIDDDNEEFFYDYRDFDLLVK